MDKHLNEIMEKLQAPFPEKDISWRIQSCGVGQNGRIWCRVLAYLDARAVQERLTEVLGIDGWKSDVRNEGNAFLCTLSIRITHEDGSTEWIHRTDGSDVTDVEPIKGAISSAFKRAAALFGVGTFLYKIGESFGDVCENGEFYGKTKTGQSFRWNAPKIRFEVPEKKNDKSYVPLETNNDTDVSNSNTGLKITVIPEETETTGIEKSQLDSVQEGQQIISEIGKIVTSTYQNKPVFGEPEKESLRNIIRSTKTDDCQSLRDLLMSVAEEYENRTGIKAAA